MVHSTCSVTSWFPPETSLATFSASSKTIMYSRAFNTNFRLCNFWMGATAAPDTAGMRKALQVSWRFKTISANFASRTPSRRSTARFVTEKSTSDKIDCSCSTGLLLAAASSSGNWWNRKNFKNGASLHDWQVARAYCYLHDALRGNFGTHLCPQTSARLTTKETVVAIDEHGAPNPSYEARNIQFQRKSCRFQFNGRVEFELHLCRTQSFNIITLFAESRTFCNTRIVESCDCHGGGHIC